MHHDLIIIGTGSGNMVLGNLDDHAFSDLNVGFVEERRAGGTCLNYGCIPSKILAYTADVVDTVSTAAEFDVEASFRGLRWSDLRDRVFDRTDSESNGGREGRENSDHTTYYEGHADFAGPKTLRIEGRDGAVTELTADQIVIANGGRPVIPSVVRDSGLPFETSDTIMRIDAPPRRLAVLGGGYIAAELAHVFAAAGSEIVIIEKNDQLLGGPQDDEVRATFTELMGKRYDLRLGAELAEISGSAGDLKLTLDDGNTIQADMLLVASGRTPNSDRLNLEVSGVDVDDSGRIVVDEYGRTTADGVFALGDVSSPIPLKHVANREAEAVSHNLMNPDDLRAISHDLVPSAVFASPQMASVGLTEEKARDEKPNYRVGRTPYGDVAYGWAMQDDSGFCKMLVSRDDGLILGAHIIGPQAASLIQIFVVAMEFGITATDLAHRPYWIHPALTEVVSNALLDGEEAA